MDRSEVVRNVFKIQDNIKNVFDNHEKFIWDKNKEKYPLLPVK